MKPRLNDRIKLICDVDAAEKEWKGTIVTITKDDDDYKYYSYGIKFDKSFSGGHPLNDDGKCPEGYGHWVNFKDFIIIDKRPTIKRKFKLTIEK